MKKHFVPVAVIAATILTATAAKKSSEPVLMTVNGKDVPVSEFVYLYQKNNQQQAEPQTLDEYVGMFVDYKLKVADAEAAGIDTTETFRKEYVGYCDDLAKPFLTDTTVTDRLRHEAYDRLRTTRNVSHIMLPIGRTPDEQRANRLRLDSIRTAILDGADFGDMAVKYSSDRSAIRNHGNMGFVSPATLPFPFIEAAWATPVGQISTVVDDTPYGYHIIRVEDEKANPGQVEARHILKMTRGLSADEAAAKKAQIDSIYTLLKNGADFADMASRESEDPGSARRGGMLDWFGPGQMVPEFEKAAFETADGEISEPFSTAYGYHIVQTTGHRAMPSYEETLPSIDRAIAADSRANEPRKAKLEQLRKQYKAQIIPSALDNVHSRIATHGKLDSIMVQQLTADYTPVAIVNGRKVLVGDVAKKMPRYNTPVSAAAAADEFDRAAADRLDEVTAEEARANLAADDEAYRNLINEYRDGILLFEISNRNVWDKSNKDREGLEKFFETHRSDYTWDTPRYKAIIVSATTDSIAEAAQQYLKDNPVGVDSLVHRLRGKFGRNIKVERKVFAKGEDAVVDYLGFGAEKPAPQGKWVAFFPYEGKILTAPEEAADVRGAVVNDYQQWLEQQWLERLHKQYPVKINKKELKKLQKQK